MTTDRSREDMIARARAVSIEDEVGRRGIALKRASSVERVGPCPACGGTDRFGVNLRKQIWGCRGCQKGGDVIALVQHLDEVDFLEACRILTGEEEEEDQRPRPIRPAPRPAPPQETGEEYERRQREKATWLWSRRKPIAGSIAEQYLRGPREYPAHLALPPTLAFLPPSKPEHHPALIAAYGLVEEPEPGVLAPPRGVDCVHLTLLKADGSGKAVEHSKRTIARPLGRPIVLAPPNDLLGLAIAEGIEDALTAHAATGLGAWASGSAAFMPALADAVPDYIECVTIYAHSDPAGQRGATDLAERLDRRGIEVFVEGLP